MKKTKLAAGIFAIASVVAIQSAFADSHIKKYKVEDDAIKASLTGKAGDAAKGRKLAVNRKKGNCLACHAISDLKDQPFHGDVGPSLDGVAGNYDEGELRLRIVNAKVFNEDTIMPAFYKADGLHRSLKKFKGKTVLSAAEVEDIVAYLLTLK
jgi:sulfur-oxidizing protein SoxX